MICSVCTKDFKISHFNQKICSIECKKQSRKEVLVKHKKTDKWKLSNTKWVRSEKRKLNEKKYSQKPSYRARAVISSAKQKLKIDVLERKKRSDRLYIKRTQGKLKKWWVTISSNGCAICSSNKKLSIDHIVPMSKGGKDNIENLQCLCFSCNAKKGNSIWLR